jgi:hypothetical protein
MDTLLVQIRRSAYFNVVVPTEPSQNRHGLIGSTQREGETQDPRRILMIYKEAASIHWWSVLKLEGSGVFLRKGLLEVPIHTDLKVTDDFRDNENTNKSYHTRGGRGCREPQTWKIIVLTHISTGGSPSIVISPYPAPQLFLM